MILESIFMSTTFLDYDQIGVDNNGNRYYHCIIICSNRMIILLQDMCMIQTWVPWKFDNLSSDPKLPQLQKHSLPFFTSQATLCHSLSLQFSITKTDTTSNIIGQKIQLKKLQTPFRPLLISRSSRPLVLSLSLSLKRNNLVLTLLHTHYS